MSTRTTNRRQLVAERARQVRTGAFSAIAGLLLLAVLQDLLGGHGDAGALGRLWRDALQALGTVVLLAQAARVSALVVDGLHQPRDRRLPRWGGGARLAFRLSATVAAGTLLGGVGIAIIANAANGQGLAVEPAWVGDVVALAVLGPAMLVLASAGVWAASEVYQGYREPARSR